MRAMAIGLGLALAWCAPAPAAPPSKAQVLWSKTRAFRIPVTVPPENRNLMREMILWVSDDSGYTWKKSARTTPDSPEFPFRAPRDGEYWFAVQTMDLKGKFYPNGDTPAEPTLRVIVDSTPPTIKLEAQGRRGSLTGVRWEVQDDHLLLNTLTLEYQAEGARDWRQVPLTRDDIAYIGAKKWDAYTADTVKARMTIRDRAGNVTPVEQVLPDGLAANPGALVADSRQGAPPVTPISSRPSPSPSADEEDPFAPVSAPPGPSNEGAGRVPANDGFNPPAPAPAPDRDFGPAPAAPEARPAPAIAPPPAAGAAPTLLVPSPRFPLRYEVEDAGPNGPALVQLWITRDAGRTWSPQVEDADRASPYNVDLGGEGTFGLWLVVQSASGLGDPPPAPGYRPQSWVEVDSAPPSVAIDRPRVGSGANSGKVMLTWRANDAHLAQRPVTLYYREDRPESPWVPIADRLDNTGKYVWTVPATVPPRLHVKVEALDTLGNRGSDDTTHSEPILLDRARPRGRIIGLDQGGGMSRQ